MPGQKHTINRKGRSNKWLGLFMVIAVFGGTLAGALAGYVRSAPTLEEVRFNPKATTYVYDSQGRVISRLFKENRDLVPIEQMPPYLLQAVVCVEDERFYQHRGIDLRSILRAFVTNAREGEVRQGGSTITQQLAKNAFLTLDRTWSRKFREVLWTIQIERRYTKDEILEAYLNQIYFGHGAHGVEAAARTYFGKSVSQLDLSEAAFLAGVTKGPSVYSPFVDYDAAMGRRNVVLSQMERLGRISKATADAARKSPLVTVALSPNEKVATYFADYILQTLLRLYGENRVYGGGLRVYTSLDLDTQKAAEKALSAGLPTLKTDANGLKQPQGALIAIEPETGMIRAMVGGRGTDQFNRAVQAYRQPGSSIKPIVYAAALERGYSPASIVKDEPISLEGNDGKKWSPENYDRKYHGDITLRYALQESINVVAVKLLQDVGARDVIEIGRRLGISSLVDEGTPNDLNASLALGGLTKGVSPLELTSAYASFANGGIYVAPVAITKITDSDGITIYEYQPDRRVVVSEALAYVLTDMLRGVIDNGTGKQAQIGRPAAGKTGTTSDYTNAWFVGYTPDLATAVWLGNDLQKQPMTSSAGNVGSAKAAAIWGSFMRTALADTPATDFLQPEQGLKTNVLIDIHNGLLVPTGCNLPASKTKREIFLESQVPTRTSPACL